MAINNSFQSYNLVEPPKFLSEESSVSENNSIEQNPESEINKFQDLASKIKSNFQNVNWDDVEKYYRDNVWNQDSENSKPKLNVKTKKFSNKQEFVSTFRPIIEEELVKQGIDLSYTDDLLAQLALESGWGKSPSGKNNYAGLKTTKGGTTRTTKEYINGKYVTVKDKFKDFDSLEEFVEYYVDRLKNKFNAFDSGDFVTNIRSRGYFTAPLNEYKRTFSLLKTNIKKLS